MEQDKIMKHLTTNEAPLRYLPEYNCLIIPLDMIWPSLLDDLLEHGADSPQDLATIKTMQEDFGF